LTRRFPPGAKAGSSGPTLGPYSRTMPRALRRSWGGGAVSHERGTPVDKGWLTRRFPPAARAGSSAEAICPAHSNGLTKSTPPQKRQLPSSNHLINTFCEIRADQEVPASRQGREQCGGDLARVRLSQGGRLLYWRAARRNHPPLCQPWGGAGVSPLKIFTTKSKVISQSTLRTP
jgi:hypothetical protein